MSDNTKHQVEALLRSSRSQTTREHGQGSWDVADVMAIVWPWLSTLHELVEALAIEDPMFHEAYEGFNDQCVFCGVEPTGSGPQIHEDTCAWVIAVDYLERERKHHQTKSEAA